MNFKIISTLALAGACVFGSAAYADNFDYTYIEGGLGDNIDDADTGVSLFFRGSYDVLPNFNIFAEYSSSTSDGDQVIEDDPDGGLGTVTNDFDIDNDSLSVGIGYHTSVSDKTDVTATIEFVSVETSIANEFGTDSPVVLPPGTDGDGYGFGVGVRHKFSDELEGNAELKYVELDNEGDTSLTVGGRYHFNQHISAGVTYTVGEDDNLATGSIRYGFGSE